MTPDEQELAKHSIEVAFSPVRDVCAKLFGQPAEEMGAMFADVVRVFRYRQTVRLVKLLQDVKAEAAALGIELGRVPDKTLLPLLEGASLEEDEDMHERWKWLLLNASDPEISSVIRPLFPDILRRLSPSDVKVLDLVCETRDLVIDRDQLIEFHGSGNDSAFQVTLDTLLGLRLLTNSPSSSIPSQSGKGILMQFRDDFVVTELGTEFVRACRNRARREGSRSPSKPLSASRGTKPPPESESYQKKSPTC